MGIDIGELIEIDDALQNFDSLDLYDASIKFFRALKFAADHTEENINLKVEEFVYLFSEKRVHFNREEMDLLQTIKTISYLFKFEESNDLFDDTDKNTRRHFDSINFLAVDFIDTILENKSYLSYYLTKILNKCFTSPVIVLYRYVDNVLLGGQCFNEELNIFTDVYLSDWYSSKITEVLVANKLYSLSLSNYKCKSIYEMYCEMLWAFSRDYYIYYESNEFLKFGLLLNEYSDCYYDEMEDSLRYSYQEIPITEKLEAMRDYFKNIYAEEYILDENDIDILLDENDDITLSGLENVFVSGNSNPDGDQQFEYMIKNSNGDDNDDETERIDDSYFLDPLKLLELFEKKEGS